MNKKKNKGNYLVNMSSDFTATCKANFPLSLFPTGQYARTLIPAVHSAIIYIKHKNNKKNR